MCDNGAKSPDAPREPFCGINAVTPLFNMFTIVSTVSKRIPENPFTKLLIRSNITPLATSIGNGSPAPTA